MKEINLDWKFHKKQLGAFLSRAKRVIVRAGRRGGKGVLGSRWSWRSASENPGIRDSATGEWKERPVTLVTATTYKQLEAFNLTALKKQMPPGFAVYREQKNKFDCNNGHEIVLRSVDNYEALRGGGEFIRGIWADEFSLYPGLVWDEILSFMLVDHDAPVLITGTPKGMNKFYELHDRAVKGEPGYETYHWTSWDNPFLSIAGRDEISRLPEMLQRQEVYAEFLEDLGGVFAGVRNCVAGDLEDPQYKETYVIGCDLAKTQDFTVMCVLKRSSRALVGFERFSQFDWEFQVAKVQAMSKRYHDATVLLDSTGLGDPIFDRLRSLGAPVEGYKFTSESKRKLVENLSLAISQGNIRFPDIPELVNELEIYAAEQLPSGVVRYGAPAGYHDDCATALMLAAWKLASGPPVYTPVIRDEGYL